MSYTVDVNVLLYASDEASPRYERPLGILERLARGPEIAYLFWPTAMAYLRIATHPSIFTRPLSAAEATDNIDQLLSRPHVQSPGEMDRFWALYRGVAADALPSGNLVSDAHIVTLMREHDVRTIWTHDRDYRRFPAIEIIDPF